MTAEELNRGQLAAGRPADRGRVGVAPDGPVRGRPAGAAARHQGAAAPQDVGGLTAMVLLPESLLSSRRLPGRGGPARRLLAAAAVSAHGDRSPYQHGPDARACGLRSPPPAADGARPWPRPRSSVIWTMTPRRRRPSSWFQLAVRRSCRGAAASAPFPRRNRVTGVHAGRLPADLRLRRVELVHQAVVHAGPRGSPTARPRLVVVGRRAAGRRPGRCASRRAAARRAPDCRNGRRRRIWCPGPRRPRRRPCPRPRCPPIGSAAGSPVSAGRPQGVVTRS